MLYMHSIEGHTRGKGMEGGREMRAEEREGRYDRLYKCRYLSLQEFLLFIC